MIKPVTRRNRSRRNGCVSARLIKDQIKELESRMDQLHSMLADRTFRLANRVSMLERGCAYVQSRDGS
jgi:hypothetical protein